MDAVPRLWPGATVFVVGGGPSLAALDAERLRGRGRVVAVNEAGLPGEEAWRIPFADVHFWGDRRFHDWNRERFSGDFPGLRVTAMGGRRPAAVPIDCWLGRDRKGALSADPARLCGECSGGMAINLAFLAGAARIVLVAFDMRTVGGRSHGHDCHKAPSNVRRYDKAFVPAIQRMAPRLRRAGVEVLNATPGSALGCFPILSLDEVLACRW